MTTFSLAVRSIAWTVLIPGFFAGYLPWRYFGLRDVDLDLQRPLHLIGVLCLVAGILLLGTCIWEFARSGKGTLSPVDPPKELVVRGPYRYVRNPMYLSVTLIVLGEFLVTGSTPLLVYWTVWFIAVNIAVLVYEEPALQRQFGAAYERYRAQVGRWIPSIPARTGGNLVLLLSSAALGFDSAPAANRVKPSGEVRFARFFSPALGVHKSYLVYLPPSYDDESARRYPVAYYLHGHGQDETAWVGDGRIDLVMDSLVVAGEPELIIVTPDGDDGRYTTWAEPISYDACARDPHRQWAAEAPSAYCVRKQRYDEYIARDLVAHVDSSYRTLAGRRHRGIAGLSMGGYGAVSLALRYPEVFSAAASHSGSLSPFYVGPHPYDEPARYTRSVDSLVRRFGPEAAAIFGRDTSSWQVRDPAHLARLLLRSRGEALMPDLYVDIGSRDHLINPNRDFHAKLEHLDISHEYEERSGGHDWLYWQRNVGESLEWLGGRLAP